MNNLSPMMSFSILALLFAVGVFVIVRFGGSSLQPEPLTIFAPEQQTDSFSRQENSRVEESQQYIPDVQTTAAAELESGQLIGSTAVLYPYALQLIEGATSRTIVILQYSPEREIWEIIETTDREIDAVYLNSLGLPINDARQLMRLFSTE